MRIFAWCVSVLFHPLLLPMYMLFITFNSHTIFSGIPVYTQRMSYMLTLLGVTMLPLLSLPLLKWLGLIGNYRLIHKQDRVFPVLATVVGAFLVFYLSRNLPFSNINLLPFLILIAGVLAFSRLYLKRHTPAQIYAGFFYGVIVVSVLFNKG